MTSREEILQSARWALGRSAGQPAPELPAPRLAVSGADPETRIRQFIVAAESLAGKVHRASSKADACAYASALLQGKTGIASNSTFLKDCGVTALAGVRTGLSDQEELRSLCAAADIGITGADFALADTGTLVMISSAEEARMISLLPPVHLAVVPCDRILTGLEELFSILPQPAQRTSSMVFITGPSRTADIEQILIRGVHGPGEIHIVLV